MKRACDYSGRDGYEQTADSDPRECFHFRLCSASLRVRCSYAFTSGVSEGVKCVLVQLHGFGDAMCGGWVAWCWVDGWPGCWFAGGFSRPARLVAKVLR